MSTAFSYQDARDAKEIKIDLHSLRVTLKVKDFEFFGGAYEDSESQVRRTC
mgnify:CR=1 FL=1